MKKLFLISTFLVSAGTSLLAKTPDQVLVNGQDSAVHKGGITVRKGAIKALIENVKQLNTKLKGREDTSMLALINDIRESIPAHNAIDVFEAFPAGDWFQFEDRPGMVMVGVLYLQQFPDKITGELKERLSKLAKAAHPLLKHEIEKII